MQLYLPTSPSFCSPLLLEAPVIKKNNPIHKPQSRTKEKQKTKLQKCKSRLRG